MTASSTPSDVSRRSTRLLYEGHGVVLGRVEHEWRLFRGMRDAHAVVLPERGGWEFLFRGATYWQAPGQLQLKPPGELLRELRREGRASYEILVFDAAPLSAASAAARRTRDSILIGPPQLAMLDPRARPFLHLFDVARRAGEEASDPLALDTAVTEASAALVELGTGVFTVGREQRAVRRAREYLREHLADPVRLDDVADHARLDKFHLVRAFRAQVGVPPYTYLTHARVHRARSLLRAGVPAGVVAHTVGFCDQSQLHRHFTRLVGLTPGRYARYARSSGTLLALGTLPSGVSSGRRRATPARER